MDNLINHKYTFTLIHNYLASYQLVLNKNKARNLVFEKIIFTLIHKPTTTTS